MLVNAVFSAMILSAVLAAPEALKVEGAASVTVAKSRGYKVKCGEPLHFSVAGPTNIHLELRGRADTKGAGVQVMRADKYASENVVALSKAKDGTKDLPLSTELNFSVPAGEQKYAVTCSEASELAIFVEASKKPSKRFLASAEKEPAPAKPAAESASASGDAYPFLGPTQF